MHNLWYQDTIYIHNQLFVEDPKEHFKHKDWPQSIRHRKPFFSVSKIVNILFAVKEEGAYRSIELVFTFIIILYTIVHPSTFADGRLHKFLPLTIFKISYLASFGSEKYCRSFISFFPLALFQISCGSSVGSEISCGSLISLEFSLQRLQDSVAFFLYPNHFFH